jgi:hypothetical protein
MPELLMHLHGSTAFSGATDHVEGSPLTEVFRRMWLIPREWQGFDPGWLESEILERGRRRWFRWLPRISMMSVVRHDWAEVRSFVASERTAEPRV